jgi:hypothetical protein
MSITKQISDYEPANIHFSMKAEVPENDWKMCLKEIRNNVREVIKNEGKILNVWKAAAKMKYGSSSVKEMDEAEIEFSNQLNKI